MHKHIFATHPGPGQSRKFVYVYVFFFPWRCLESNSQIVTQGRANHEVQTVNWNAGNFEAESAESTACTSRFSPSLIHGSCTFFASNSRFMRLFQGSRAQRAQETLRGAGQLQLFVAIGRRTAAGEPEHFRKTEPN